MIPISFPQAPALPNRRCDLIELLPFFLLMLYIVPFCVAAARDHPSTTAILVFNLAFGWTVVGWMAAFAWAALTPAND